MRISEVSEVSEGFLDLLKNTSEISNAIFQKIFIKNKKVPKKRVY